MTSQTTILDSLAQGIIQLKGQFLLGSNGTFLVNLCHATATIQAVYKPNRTERPLWDFPDGTLAFREVAAFLFDHALRWDLVPPTIYRQDAPLGPGSLQVFIHHNPAINYFHLAEDYPDLVSKILLFDFMLNNADRKAGHVILDSKQHIWLIDHGLCFHPLYKLRTVAWEHAGEGIPENLIKDMIRVYDDLAEHRELYKNLSSCLDSEELESLIERIRILIAERSYPVPPVDRRSIPWPPI